MNGMPRNSIRIGSWPTLRRLLLLLMPAVVGCEPVSPDNESELTGRWVSHSQLADPSGNVGCVWVDRVLDIRSEGWLADSLFTPEDTDVQTSTCATSLLDARRRTWELLSVDRLVVEPGFATDSDTLSLQLDSDSLQIGSRPVAMIFLRDY